MRRDAIGVKTQFEMGEIRSTVRLDEEFHEEVRIAIAKRRLRSFQQAVEAALRLWLAGSIQAEPPPARQAGINREEQELIEKFLAFWRTASRDQRKIVEMIISAERSARAAGRQQSAAEEA